MDKNVREKEALYHLELSGTEDIKKSFTEVECELETYFFPKEEKEYLMEYDFDSLPQLKEKLNSFWENEECMKGIIQTVLVAAMKNKPSREAKETRNIENSGNIEGELPAFIYNF